MHEYAELNTVCDRHEDTIDRLRRDLVALDAVYRSMKHESECARGESDAAKTANAEDRRRLEQRCERLEREVEEREHLWRGKSSVIDTLQREKDAAVQELRDAFAKERQEWHERLQSLELDLRTLHEEYKSQQAQFIAHSTEQQRLFATEREQYTESSQKLLREVSSSHHASLGKMTEEVSHSKELSSMLAKKEREMLQERIDHEQAMRIDAERRRERETSDATLELERVRQALDAVTKQRDELLSEATFQLEIVSELRTEKAACKAELAALRIAAHQTAAPSLSTMLSAAMPSTLRAPLRSATTSPIPSNRLSDDEQRRLEQQVIDLTAAVQESNQHSAALEGTLEQLRSEMVDEKRRYQETIAALTLTSTEQEADLARLRSQLAVQSALMSEPRDSEARAQILKLERTIVDLQRSMTTVQNDFADECADHEATKAHQEDQERTLQQRLSAATRRVEELQNSLADQHAENTKLVEECEALRIAMGDMEQSYADALAAVA
jgi:chromosome segregation ATPase